MNPVTEEWQLPGGPCRCRGVDSWLAWLRGIRTKETQYPVAVKQCQLRFTIAQPDCNSFTAQPTKLACYPQGIGRRSPADPSAVPKVPHLFPKSLTFRSQTPSPFIPKVPHLFPNSLTFRSQTPSPFKIVAPKLPHLSVHRVPKLPHLSFCKLLILKTNLGR